MLKRFLLFIANKIIDKYDIHILGLNSKVQLENYKYGYFKIKSYEIGQNNFINYINFHCDDKNYE